MRPQSHSLDTSVNFSAKKLAGARKNQRADLHGLRGLAVLLVVFYHIFVGRVSGGVDVFLFLSAYFLTGSLLKQLHRRQLVNPVKFWLLAFKRLLPPAFTVILLTFLAVYALLPAGAHMPALNDAIFAVLQVENWWLISQQADYYALDRAVASPYQHFWSLAIQSQIFLLWPLLFALLSLLLKIFGSRAATNSSFRSRALTLTFLLFALLTAVSFSWSVHSTQTQQEVAYFDTFARAWEFSCGALVALWLPLNRVKVPTKKVAKIWRGGLSLAAVGVLVSMGVFVDVAGLFPGWIALLPLSAATVVIATAKNPLLENPVLQFFGNISYAFYLTHWPILIVWMAFWNQQTPTALQGIAIFILSIAVSWVLTKLVDTPFRKLPLTAWRGFAGPATVAVSLTVALTILGGTQALFSAQQAQRIELAKQISPAHPGALTFASAYARDLVAESAAAPIPAAADLGTEWWALPQDCLDTVEFPELLGEHCTVRWEDKLDRSKQVFFWGNSRMEQLAAGIDDVFEAKGWKATAVLVGGCAPGFDDDQLCLQKQRETLELIKHIKPQAVVMQTTFMPSLARPKEASSAAAQELVHQLLAANIKVIGVRDHARLELSPTICLETTKDEQECSQQTANQFGLARADNQLLQQEGVYALDLNEQICPGGKCQPVIGNIHVFLDENHITKSYSRTLRNAIAAQLAEQDFKW